ESVLYNGWPDISGTLAALGSHRPWWSWRVLDDAARFERDIATRFGQENLERFRKHARRWCIQGRKWQTEVFRSNAAHGGLVQNAIRDVASCPLGFMDDLDRWRITPAETRPWLSEAVILLQTPNWQRGFASGSVIRVRVGVSNFSSSNVNDKLQVDVTNAGRTWRCQFHKAIKASPGQVTWIDLEVELPETHHPDRLDVRANIKGVEPNRWTLWLLPLPSPCPDGVVRQTGDSPECIFSFEERRYSSGWGLEVESWQAKPPFLDDLMPTARPFVEDPPPDAQVIVTTSLNDAVLDSLNHGARVLHLPDNLPGSLQTIVPALWGQSPLILEHGPLKKNNSDLLLDLLDRDLHLNWIRSIPTGRLGIIGHVYPCIRYACTHDATERIGIVDDLLTTRVGNGVLLVSTLDHTSCIGRWLLPQFCEWLTQPEIEIEAQLSSDRLRGALVTQQAHASVQ
ncbi:MAG: hypothetical protein MI725_06460, partial [Pirellulales bacterium]|nr:hypothetical protein [Pirellulales bacterium]